MTTVTLPELVFEMADGKWSAVRIDGVKFIPEPAAEPKPAKRDRGMEMAREMVQWGEMSNFVKFCRLGNAKEGIGQVIASRQYLHYAHDCVAEAINARAEERAEEVKAEACELVEECFSSAMSSDQLKMRIKAL